MPVSRLSDAEPLGCAAFGACLLWRGSQRGPHLRTNRSGRTAPQSFDQHGAQFPAGGSSSSEAQPSRRHAAMPPWAVWTADAEAQVDDTSAVGGGLGCINSAAATSARSVRGSKLAGAAAVVVASAPSARSNDPGGPAAAVPPGCTAGMAGIHSIVAESCEGSFTLTLLRYPSDWWLLI
jgi:hypothetical protein